jgi:hypothetical protein
MDRKFGIYIFLGFGYGALFGVFLGKPIGNTSLGVGIGALAGIFIGWFIAAAISQIRKDR